MEFKHVPVLLNEVLEGLNILEDGIYVDGTLGGAGHSKGILCKLSKKGKLIGIDRDEEALKAASMNLKDFDNKELVHGNHDDISEILESLKIDKVDGILLDLGVSSYQLDERNRGFSYNSDNFLDMRMDQRQKNTAFDVVNYYSEEKLIAIFFKYGEEKFSRNIVKNIIKSRREKLIETTGELVKIIEKSKPFDKKGHPAKQVFQAIRIEVNNEIEPLKNTVLNSIKLLKNGGRICIITFHSLEDRAVKEAFKKALGECLCSKDLPKCVCNPEKLGVIVNKKAIEASKEELKLNKRSKSAKLRIFERREG